jgi:hypothetical protein
MVGEGGKKAVCETVTVLGVFSLSIGVVGSWSEFSLRSLMFMLVDRLMTLLKLMCLWWAFWLGVCRV